MIRAIFHIAETFFILVCRGLLRFRLRKISIPSSSAKIFAIVSYYLPPAWSGGAIVLSRILSRVPTGTYCLVSRLAYSRREEDDFIPKLPATYHHVPGSLFLPSSRHGLGQWMTILSKIGQRAYSLARILEAEKVQTVVATTGDLVEVPAAFVAARAIRARFVLYVFDDFVTQWWQFPAAEQMARCFEKYIVEKKAGLVVPNEHMASELESRYGSECVIVRNPTAAPVSNASWAYRRIDGSKPISLLYTGAVYAVNESTVKSVLRGVQGLQQTQVRLVLYTAQTGFLDKGDDAHERLELNEHVPPYEIARIQEDADILLLPFTFDPKARTLIATSGTAKLADYLASGRPVFAVAPADTFIVDYLVSNNCGFVCTSDRPEDISVVLKAIYEDQERCALICTNARRCAARDFSPDDAAAAFMEAVGAV